MERLVKQDSLAGSLFGREPHNYVWLTSRWPFNWDKKPKHALCYPRDWEQLWEGDFGIEPSDFLPQAVALESAASQNRQALKDTMQEDGCPDECTLVFRLGG